MPRAEPNPSLSTEAQKVSPETAIPMEPIQAAGFQAKAGNTSRDRQSAAVAYTSLQRGSRLL